jgi:hypothetical protein
MRPVSSLSMAEHNIPSSSALPELMPVAAGPFEDLTQIGPHRSRLPLVLYLLSFGRSQATGCPSWRTTRSHPYTLYAIGTVAALLAGLTHSAWGLVYGYWTRGMTGGLIEDQLLDRGKQAGWIMAIIGLWSLVWTCVYMMCCEYRFAQADQGQAINLSTPPSFNSIYPTIGALALCICCFSDFTRCDIFRKRRVRRS